MIKKVKRLVCLFNTQQKMFDDYDDDYDQDL